MNNKRSVVIAKNLTPNGLVSERKTGRVYKRDEVNGVTADGRKVKFTQLKPVGFNGITIINPNMRLFKVINETS